MNPKTNKQAWDRCLAMIQGYAIIHGNNEPKMEAYWNAARIIKEHMPRSNDRTITKAKRRKK